jgi:hypothetical protein
VRAPADKAGEREVGTTGDRSERIVARRPRSLRAWTIALSAAVGFALLLFSLGGYTPTTTAYVLNDTATTVTLDGCSDTSVTVEPTGREQISPFMDAAHAVCTVFRGGSDLGTPIGCRPIPAVGGRTVSGAVARVSEMLASPSHCRS